MPSERVAAACVYFRACIAFARDSCFVCIVCFPCQLRIRIGLFNLISGPSPTLRRPVILKAGRQAIQARQAMPTIEKQQEEEETGAPTTDGDGRRWSEESNRRQTVATLTRYLVTTTLTFAAPVSHAFACSCKQPGPWPMANSFASFKRHGRGRVPQPGPYSAACSAVFFVFLKH